MVFILALQNEERMVGSNPKPCEEPFGCKKCQGNVRALQNIPFPDHQEQNMEYSNFLAG